LAKNYTKLIKLSKPCGNYVSWPAGTTELTLGELLTLAYWNN
jgi:hypothetical protein